MNDVFFTILMVQIGRNLRKNSVFDYIQAAWHETEP